MDSGQSKVDSRRSRVDSRRSKVDSRRSRVDSRRSKEDIKRSKGDSWRSTSVYFVCTSRCETIIYPKLLIQCHLIFFSSVIQLENILTKEKGE